MSRRIDFDPDAFVVRYDGLDALLVLRRELRVPYDAVENVTLGLTDAPSTLAWRFGLADPITGTRRGRFWWHGKRWFLDLKRPERAVTLRLRARSEFDVVAIEVDQPESLLQAVSERRP